MVTFNTFTVEVHDGGGNFMSTFDRFASTDNETVIRKLTFTGARQNTKLGAC